MGSATENRQKFDFSVDFVVRHLIEERDYKARKRLIVLREYMAGHSGTEIAERYDLDIAQSTVYQWLRRFREHDDFSEALYDAPDGRPASPDEFDFEPEDQTVALDRYKPYEESRERGYALLDSEIYYIRTNARKNTTQQSVLEDRIERAIEQLPERIANLHVDIGLFQWYLHHSNQDVPETLWHDTVEASFNNLYKSLPENRYITRGQTQQPVFLLGYNLGTVARFLLDSSPGRGTRWHDAQMRLLRGMVFGTLGYSHTELEQEHDAVDQFIGYLSSHRQIRKSITKRTQDGWVNLNEKPTDTGTADVIRAELERHGISTILRELLTEAIHDILRDGQVRNTEETINTIVEDIVDHVDIDKYEQLLQSLSDDKQHLESKFESALDHQGVPLRPALFGLHEADSAKSRDDLREYYDKPVDKGGVTANLNRLSHEEQKGTWTNHSIVDRTPDGWTLTDYGTLLTRALFGEQDVEKEVVSILFSQCVGADDILRLVANAERFAREEKNDNFAGEAQFDVDIEIPANLPNTTQYQHFRESLYEDYCTIQFPQLNDGYTALPALEAVYNAEQGLTTANICGQAYPDVAKEQDNAEYDQANTVETQVTSLLSHLSNLEPGTTWTNHSLMYNLDGTWHLSPYGSLLTQLLLQETSFDMLDIYPRFKQVMKAAQSITEDSDT